MYEWDGGVCCRQLSKAVGGEGLSVRGDVVIGWGGSGGRDGEVENGTGWSGCFWWCFGFVGAFWCGRAEELGRGSDLCVT